MTYLAGRYKILELIDIGRRSRVYKAKDSQTLNIVGLKIFNDEVINNKNFIANLIDEATVLNEIDCPYIVKIYDVGNCYFENKECYYIASEYIEGESLDKAIQLKEVDLNQSLNIIKQIAQGIDVAHRHHIIHGDLQPHNILIDERGLVKINNFGIVSSNNNMFKTNIQNTVKEIDYLSPEQASISHTEKSSDIYSLGILFYELIFNKRPYYSENNIQNLVKYMNIGINWNKLDLYNIPNEIIDIIKKLTNRSRKERYSNLQHLIVDICKCMYLNSDINETEFCDENIIKTSLSRVKKKKKIKKLQRKKFYKVSSIGILGLIFIIYYILL